ncbi:MAG: DUF72 domain-containing protein [Candidatus Eremiobacteraeota bacterium]|nr:DUF72 domain-containing protein [Candidatus Eremiobacteraeota bacterium]
MLDYSTVDKKICIGTSGWTYADWRRTFYPEKLRQRDWLTYYAARFATVELNATTYRLPKRDAIDRWLSAVPDGFRFAVKLSRLITHRRNLGEPQRFIDNFFAAIAPLAPKIATILVQLPPYLARDDALLDAFLAKLPPSYRYAVEFREPSWYAEQTYATLRRHGAALCVHDLRGSQAPDVVTAPFAYVRLHGPLRTYAGSYSNARLESWASRIASLTERAGEAWIYFNNDQRAYATKNAATLGELLRCRRS